MELLRLFSATVLLFTLAGTAAEPLKLSEAQWDFESGTLEGWTVVEGNLGKQPSPTADDRNGGNFGKHGKYFIGTFEDGDKTAGDKVTGEIRSPIFVVDVNLMGLLLGGGGDATRTYVALCSAEGDKELIRSGGRDTEAMDEVVWDVSRFKGKRVYVKVVDKSAGDWGHINVDNVRALTKEEIAKYEQEQNEAVERARKASEELHLKWAAINGEYAKHVLDPMPRKVYSGKGAGACKMPVGGVGAGGFLIGGDGGFGRWAPGSFLALRTKVGETVTARKLNLGQGGVQDIEFAGEFPIAYHTFKDAALPVRVNMESFSPFIPLNEKDSGLPVVFFFITAENIGKVEVEVSLVASFPNSTNVNGTFKSGRFSGVELARGEKSGSRVLVGTDANTQAVEPWNEGRALSGVGLTDGNSAKGAVRVSFALKPGEKRQVPFAWAWHQTGGVRDTRMYESWFADIGAVCKYADENFDRLVGDTRRFHDTFFSSTLPWYVLDRVSSQCSTLVTPVVNWTKLGNIYAWEGYPNSCSGSCTHVWNYEQTLAHVFPGLERKMRELNLGPGMQADGGVYNRLGAADAPWGIGTEGPASDGHASTLSKAYREWRMSADDAWLKQRYPAIKKAMEFWIKKWDGADEDGVARGTQFNTYDSSVVGANTFIGSQYLAALRAAEEMAKVCGDDESAQRWRGIFVKGSETYAKECWDEEYKYFVQRIPPDRRAADYGNACFVDQVLGQWWALVNDVGYVLPRDKVDASLAAIWKWNFVGDMSLYKYHYGAPRIMIWGKGKGLMICTWPRGDYLKGPITYREEVWTGCEYQAAASMIWEGMVPEGLSVVKAIHERYNNGVRNPWDEIECGDHYSRAMSSWSVLLAAQGYSYIGPRGKLGFDPRVTPEKHRSFFTAAEGWGSFVQEREGKSQRNQISLAWGRLRLTELSLGIPREVVNTKASVQLGQALVEGNSTAINGKVILKFQPALELSAGQTLRVISSWE